MINAFRRFIECQHLGIPYKLKRKWYNEELHIPHQPIQIHPFRENGTYIDPKKGNIITVIIIERERRVYARYTINKLWSSTDRKNVYNHDDVFCNLTFHSLIYEI